MTWDICVAVPCDLALLAAVFFLLGVSLVKAALSVRDLFVSLHEHTSGDDDE